MFRVKKKNLMALTLAAVLLASGIGVYKVEAAKLIDENKTCSVTFMTQPDSKVAGDITIELYKIADVKSNGQYENLIFEDKSGLLSDGELDTSEADEFIRSADGATKNMTPVKVTIEAGETSSVKKDIEKGLYLYVPSADDTNRYKFTFTKSIISIPTSNYIQGGTTVDENGNIIQGSNTSDDWIYDVKVAVKSEAEQRYGYLRIEKDLTRYNESLGAPSFVYLVEAKLDGNTVFSNYYTINYEDFGEDNFVWVAGPDSGAILPADAEITVTEVYSGASYTQKASAYYSYNENLQPEKITSPKILADDLIVASFTNDYDNELQVGATSILNTYTLDKEKKVYQYKGNNLPTEEVPQ